MPFTRAFSRHRPAGKWAWRCRWFRHAANVWNCLAFHLLVNSEDRTMRFTFAIPGLVTSLFQTPLLPVWLGGRWLAAGEDSQAEYGFWHDYYETKLQWRQPLDSHKLGLQLRKVHRPTKVPTVQVETTLSALVEPEGSTWAAEHGVDRWKLYVSTTVAQGYRWWIPMLYDHSFVLQATEKSGIPKEVHVWVGLKVHLVLIDIFHLLVQKYEAEQAKETP